MQENSSNRIVSLCANRIIPLLSKLCAGFLALPSAIAQVAPSPEAQPKQLEEVVVSASRSGQRRFDAPASIDAVEVDTFRQASPLVNLSELLQTVPGIQIRERQNYAQDLQISVRGFGTRSTFGVRGVRILIDGIPATMPDGQGQASTASLASASRIEVLRGPLAQLYGNAAGGVLQVFTKEPSLKPEGSVTVGFGSDQQRQTGASISGGSETLGGLLDISRYSTDGYRDHSAARRTQLNGKLVARPSKDTTITGVYNNFSQPLSQDPLGLTRAQFESNPRQVDPVALTFDTRKTIDQQQGGVVVEHKLTENDTINARAYAGTRQVFQTLSFSGRTTATPTTATTSGGVVDLDRDYGGLGINWNHKTTVSGLPLSWTVGAETDKLREHRRGFVNENGTPGATRRDEFDEAANMDFFGQVDWTFAPAWRVIAGLRSSRVKISVDDRYVVSATPPSTPFSPNDSGSVQYRHTSPVVGLVWNATDSVNLYANLGQGFETPTLAESAYSPGNAGGPNFALRPAISTQAEIGAKIRSGKHSIDLALFEARSKDEIVPQSNNNGRATFQNADGVRRRGLEAGWQANWGQVTTKVGYTLLNAEFTQAFGAVAAGNRLPGVPQHSLAAEAEYRVSNAFTTAVEMRSESKVYVNDSNADAAPAYTVLNLRAGYELKTGPAKLYLFGRIDNVFNEKYAGSVIVNDGNNRFFEPAPGRRLFVGLRTGF